MDKFTALDKIRKLANLSKSSNEHEAAAAIRQARALMDRFDISEADLVGIEICHKAMPGKNYTRPDAIERQILALVATVFHVRVVMMRGDKAMDRKTHWMLFGRQERIEVVEYFYGVLMALLRSKREDVLRRLASEMHLSKAAKHGLSTTYALGWIEGVRQNIHLIAMPEEESTLIQKRQALVFGEAMKPLQSKTEFKIPGAKAEHVASLYCEGHAHGEQVRLHHGVDDSQMEKAMPLPAPPLMLA